MKLFSRPQSQDAGYAMPMAFGLGLCMLAMAGTTILLAQDGRDTAVLRRDSAASVLVSDSAIAEILTSLAQPQNATLLGKNYDPINPRTGTTYLGPDGEPNSGDEGSTEINQWTDQTYACETPLGLGDANLLVSNTFNPHSTFQILAYRYDPTQKIGHLLIEGNHEGVASHVYVSLAIAHDARYFPGVLAIQSTYWQGRAVQGANAHVYFNPSQSAYTSLTAKALPNEAERGDYQDAIWSGALDGFAEDHIQRALVACDIDFSLSGTPTGTLLSAITAGQTLSGQADGVKRYQMPSIVLTGNAELKVDTTAGPVHLYVKGPTTLKNTSKIRNIRTDGKPPQVGDLRIIQALEQPVVLYDNACIENAFVYAPQDDLHLLTTGAGCPGSSNSNLVGVVWVEDIENSTNSPTARAYDRLGGPDFPTTGVTSGVEVPADVSSLVDALESINFPVFYRVSGVTAWRRVNL